jgi:S-adenosyl-L-methionine hydrolase (adenosine-forming)
MSAEHVAPLVALLSDFGTADGYVGVMKAVVLGIAPGVPLVDLTHDVPPQDVRHGAWLLHTMWRFLPEGSVCLAVVDPGVGTARRPIALEAASRSFVGPDNGLFSYVLAESTVTGAVVLDDRRFHLAALSATFHGRDVFAPVAGHLAAGKSLAALGSSVDVATLERLPLPQPEPHAEGLLGHVIHVDRFGNLITDFGPELALDVLHNPRVRLRVGWSEVTARATTFATGPTDVPFALLDSSGYVAIAVRDASAAARLGAGVGTDVLAIGFQPDESAPKPAQ